MALAGEATRVNAGVVAYACSAGGAEYLLAYDAHRARQAWAAFGGRPQQQETASQTALREFRQETNCVFSAEQLAAYALKGPSISDGFHTFVLEVPYVETTVIEQPRACVDVERSDWIWVPHDALIAALDSDLVSPMIAIQSRPPVVIPLWSNAVQSMRQARSDGYLHNADPCRF